MGKGRPVRVVLLTAIATHLVTGSPAKVAAQVPSPFCRLIKDETERLRCYDAAVSGPTSEPKWRVTEGKNPMTDAAEFTATLQSTDTRSSLIFRCVNGRETEGIVLPAGFYNGSGSNVRVIYRVGDQAPFDALWMGSNNGRAAFMYGPISFIRSLPQGGTLFLRVMDRRDAPHDATFQTGDVAAIRDRLGEVCKWPDRPFKP